jgi:hypothetical protein
VLADLLGRPEPLARLVRVDRARRDRIHANAVLRPLDRERARQVHHACLRGGGVHRAGAAGPRVARDDVDDLRVVAAPLDHAARELARAEERPVENDADHRAPAVRRELLGLHVEVAGRVVDQRRDRPQLGLGDVEGLRDGVRLADVGGNGDAVAQLRDRLLEHVPAAAEHGDLRAQPPELQRHRTPEPAAAAGDERDAPVERSFRQHQVSSSL